MRLPNHWPIPISPVNRRLAALLLLLLAATVSSVIYLSSVLQSVNNLIKEGSAAVADSLTLQDLYINIQTAETAQRGYIITADTSYLNSYQVATAAIPKDMTALSKQPTFGNTATFKQLRSLIDQKLAELKLTIDTRQTQGFDAASQIVATNKGKELMDQIRLLVYQASAKEFTGIIPREAQSQRNLDRALAVGGILIVFVTATCVVIVRFFRNAILRERAVEGAKNEFLSLASHQLRTPATNVRQYLGLVLEGYLGELSTEQQEALEVANRNNNTEISIINDLLNVAKLDLNNIQLHKEPLPVGKLIDEVAGDYAQVAQNKKQRIRTKYPADLPDVLADGTYLKSVLENLVDNACKYSPMKGTITVRASAIKPLSRGQILIEIIDSGIGISKRDLPKLFKKFSRLPLAINSAEGTGLGLYWVKQLVELHGGTISVSSTPGKGSTFRITLPTG